MSNRSAKKFPTVALHDVPPIGPDGIQYYPSCAAIGSAPWCFGPGCAGAAPL